VDTLDDCPLDCEWDHDGHVYLHCWIPTSQPDASVICAENGMRLARIDDADEQLALWEWHQPDDAWLGGSDEAAEGTWKWEDGDVFWDDPTAVLYEDWAGGEPSNSAAIEHCLMLNGPSNWWNDHDCNDPLGFICERY